ncbi:MAG: AMP-binding protein [Myxococcales bacterium]|nr:AMP-binding protein [Myxococcales bacterium]
MDEEPTFDFEHIVAGLEGTIDPTPSSAPWLEASREHPEIFFRQLLQFSTAPGRVHPKSRVGEGYDLYHDLVTRHLGQSSKQDDPSSGGAGSMAIIAHDPGVGFRRLTYDGLNQLSGRLAQGFARQGVEAGQSLCIVLPVGIEYASALLAALRMGLVVTCLPPAGETFLRRRLQSLDPDHLVIDPAYLRIVPEYQDRALLQHIIEEQNARAEGESHTYGPGDPCLRCCSPLCPDPFAVVEVSAERLFFGALRDAALTFPILESDRVAIPGFEPLQHQPSMLLAALMGGGGFVEVEAERVVEDPDLLSQAAATVVGVVPAVRDALAQGPASRFEKIRRWFRDGGQPLDWEAWEPFARRLADKGVSNFGCLANAAFGGTFLFSPKLMRFSGMRMLPAPGEPFELTDVNLSGQPSTTDSGLYHPTADDGEQMVGLPLITRPHVAGAFGGMIGNTRGGQTYPIDEAVEVVMAHPEVEAATVVFGPSERVTLLVFTDPGQAGRMYAFQHRWAEELRSMMARMLSPRLVPNVIRFFPIYARHDADGALDRVWCRSGYFSGSLGSKSQDALFRNVSELRRLVARYAVLP